MGYNMYTSEPDLRFTDSRQQLPMDYQPHHHHGDKGAFKGRMSRSKKKYRAPQIPSSSSHHNGVSIQYNLNLETELLSHIEKPVIL